MVEQDSNQKRLAALHNRKLTQCSQNEVVRKALSATVVNKITKFSDSDEESEEEQKNTDILHDVEEESDIHIVDKPHFFGKKGEKLMMMQSKIGSDERFQLDERFDLQSDSEDDHSSEDDETKELNNERQTLYNVMDSVLMNLGMKVNKHNSSAENQHIVDQFVRFDPTNAEHDKYLIKKVPEHDTNTAINESETTAENKENACDKTAKPPEAVPLVDERTFFEVKTDFNKAISTGSSNGFSFKFDFAIDSPQTVADETSSTPIEKLEIRELQHDSSDDEETIDLKLFNSKESVTKSRQSYFFYSINPLFKKDSVVQFRRTKTVDEIEQEWMAQRQQLTADYKKRHKDALRFQKKFVSKS